MGFPYTFPFDFYVPLIYARDYKIEVRDVNGALLRFITHVDDVIHDTTLNAPAEITISLPFSDPATPYLTGQNELWIRGLDQSLLGKYIIITRVDTNRGGVKWIKIIAASYLHQLTEEVVRYVSFDDELVSDIVDTILALQQHRNPIVSNTSASDLPASIVDERRTLNITKNTNIFQILLQLLKTFIPVIKLSVDSDRNIIWEDMDSVGDSKRFDVSRNVGQLQRTYRYERAVSRLYCFGSNRTGTPVRLGDEGGQQGPFYASGLVGNDLTLHDDFEGSGDPSDIQTGDAVVLSGQEHIILAIVVGSGEHVLTLDGTPTFTEPEEVIVRRDYIDSDRFGAISRKEIFIDHTGITLGGYNGYIMQIDDTFRDLISSDSTATIYFTADDYVTILDSTTATYTPATGALDVKVLIPKVSSVKDTRIHLILSTNSPAVTPVGGSPHGTQVDRTIFPALSMIGFREADFVDERIEDVSFLQLAAEVYLAKLQRPVYSYTVSALDLTKVQNENESDDYIIGEAIHLIDTDIGVDDQTRIVSATWPMSRPAELALQFSVLDEWTIDTMFANAISELAAPPISLALTDDALGIDDSELHGHDNKETLDEVPNLLPSVGFALSTDIFGADNGWNNIPAIRSDDDGLDSAWTTGNLTLSLIDYSFSVPDTQVIAGVEVIVVAKHAGTANLNLQLTRDDGAGNAVAIGDVKTIALVPAFSRTSIGGATDLWGITDLLPDEVSEDNFGVLISSATSGSRLDVDYVKVKVHYEGSDGNVLTKTDTGDLSWETPQQVRLAKVISGPGVGGQQLYQVELYVSDDKSASGELVNDCFVPDDATAPYTSGDFVMVVVPPESKAAIGYHAIIIASAGGGTSFGYPSQFFGIIEGGVKSPFDGT